jgi:methionyl-tRNA formyltransferase
VRELPWGDVIPVLDPPDVNAAEARETLAQFGADVLVVCDFGQILSNETLSVARLGGINLHGSLLPKYRGAAPVNWALWHGEAESGVTVIHMTPRLDAGPCLVQRATPVDPEEDAQQLEKRLAHLGIEPVHQALAMLETWDGVSQLGEIQDRQLASKAPRLKKADGLVDWSRSARQIADQVRALKPWPGTFTHWQRPEGEPLRLILDRVQLVSVAVDAAEAGTVVRRTDQELCVATGQGALALCLVKPAGKLVLDIAEFLRGYPVQLGDRFA